MTLFCIADTIKWKRIFRVPRTIRKYSVDPIASFSPSRDIQLGTMA